MQIITYHSENAKPEWSWVGYIVLTNGEYLGIMFRDSTEDVVKAKAEQFWQDNYKPVGDAASEAVKIDRRDGQHLIGKVWMINEATREKRRVLPEDVAALGPGWIKGGPRSR